MKKFTFYCVLLTFVLITQSIIAQNQNSRFKMAGPKSETVEVNETWSSSTEIFPFKKNGTRIYGLAVTADIELENEESLIRLLLVDSNFEEYMIYEGYSLLDNGLSWSIDEICEETAVLGGIKAHSVKIEIETAEITLKNLVFSTQLDPSIKIDQAKKEKKQAQNEEKINKINKNLREKGKNWVAGITSVAELTYSEKKLLYGQSTFPPGFEYYAGGVISTSTEDSNGSVLKSATASPYVDEWDWRNRHGQNWVSPVVNQGLCGSCWAFAAAGATEAMVNLYFNQLLNLDLSEQDLLSCSGAGSCSGGYPSTALNYITNTGIVDEASFPYSQTDESCQNKSKTPNELIKIAGRVDFGSSLYPRSEDNLKKMLIEMGPISGGLYDWSHAMTLVGYKVVEEGDKFYYRDLDLNRYWITVEAGDPLIGKTVWMFKNSWGDRIGDGGYVYVETPITNMGWTHGLKTPVISGIKNYEVICEDKDGDGYYWWGLGEKPATCNGPDEPDGDDSDPTLGPLDEYGNCIKLTPTLTLNNVPASKNLGQNPELPTCDSGVSSTNGCSEAPVTCLPGEILENGCERSQTFTYSATDDCGNIVSATTTYTWEEDLTPPLLVNIPADEYLGNSPELPSCDLDVSATDECSEAEVTCFPGEIIENGCEKSQTFTYTATDEFGNTVSASTKFTWTEDITPPILVNVPENQDLGHNPELPTCDAGVTATDDCSNATLICTPGEIIQEGNGRSQTFTYLATDAYGNTASATTTYTWTEEQIVMVLSGVPADEDLGCNPELPTCDVDVTATDGCSEATVVCTPGEILEDGCQRSQTFNYTTTDDCGNTVSATTTYTWTEDLTPPVLTNVPADADLGHNPELPTCDAGVMALDECSEVTLTCTPGDIVQNEDMRTQTFTYLASDECGNSASATTTYTWTEGIHAPSADFTATSNILAESETVQFDDLSANSPESWSWKFEGGTPTTSTLQHPAVRYDIPGNYAVSLTVTNAGGSDTKTVENFITVEEILPEYCLSKGNALEEWIASVTLDAQTHQSGSTGVSGYQDFSGTTIFSAEAGTSVEFSLIAGFLNRWYYEYWRIWIDYNADNDFDDPGELVYTSSLNKGEVSGSFTIPEGVSETTRMRISMKRDAVPTTCETFSNGEVKDYTIHFEKALPQPPAANFSAENTQINPGNTVQFTDLSSNEPTSWYWEFPGGTPDRSSDSNPLITYENPGEYDVILLVSKDGFEPSEMTKMKYIIVTDDTSTEYCTPVAVNSSANYIQNITIGDVLNSSTAGSGYSLSASTVLMAPGQNYSVSLSPNDSRNRNFWRIWIDLNGDNDFDDADETLLAINNKKGPVTSNITIPAYAAGNTRMRVAMRNNSAPSPCDNYFDGEVKDFIVSFEVAPQASFLSVGNNPVIGETLGMKLFPNPVLKELTILLDVTSPDDYYTIYNMNGSKVKTDRVLSEITIIDLSEQAPGIYILVIQNNRQIFREKVIKK